MVWWESASFQVTELELCGQFPKLRYYPQKMGIIRRWAGRNYRLPLCGVFKQILYQRPFVTIPSITESPYLSGPLSP